MIVFISYSSKNCSLVIQLVALLTEMGYDVRYDQQIGTGDDWWHHILADIRACSAFLYALSPEYVDSYPCELEYHYAVALNRPILPVMIALVDFGQMPTYIAQSQVLDFTDLNNTKALARLSARFRQLEQQPLPLPSPLPPEPPAPIAKLNTVIERVTNWSVRLTPEEQTTLLNDIRPFLRKREARSNALYALRRFRQHSDVNGPRDLYTDTSDEIDSVLETYAGNMTLSQPIPLASTPDPTPPPETDPRPGNRLRTALMTVLIVVVVSGIGIGGWLMTHPPATATNTPVPIAQVGSATQGTSSASTPTSIQTATPTLTPTYAPTDTLTTSNRPIPTVADDKQWTPLLQAVSNTQMALVPPGCFKMGSDPMDKDARPDEQPQFQMCFSQPLWIDVNDVTNADYQKFIDAGGYKQQGTWWTDAGWTWYQGNKNYGHPANYSGFTDANQPRVGITWYEAHAYCQWRGARLPTEAEWEYAARGPSDPIYPWGFHSADVFDSSKVVSSVGSSTSYTAPVGSKPDGVSWVGGLDMSGNVRQWTSSIYNDKAYGPNYKSSDYESITDITSYRVLRGGSKYDTDSFVFRAAFRNTDQPFNENDITGFRCVRSN